MSKSIRTGKTNTILSRNITKRRFILDGLGTATDWGGLKKYRSKLDFMDDAPEGFTVSARELHKALGSKQRFAAWVDARFNTNQAEQGQDYLVHNSMQQIRKKAGSTGLVERVDYLLTPDLSKMIAMLEHNEMGLAVRRYFLFCERIAQKYASYNALRAEKFSELDRRLGHELAKRGAKDKINQVHHEVCKAMTGLAPHEWREMSGLSPRDALKMVHKAVFAAGYESFVAALEAGSKGLTAIKALAKNKAYRIPFADYGMKF